MTQGRKLRWPVLLALLAGLAWLVATDPLRTQVPAVADVPPRPAQKTAASPLPSAGQGQNAEPVVRELIPRERLIAKPRPGSAARDLFASHSWAPPPAPAPAAALAVAAPPTAPARPPFSYLGKRRDEMGWQVYLGRGDLALIVCEGETIEGGYRVESIKPPTLTLVRADNRQQIAIGEWE